MTVDIYKNYRKNTALKLRREGHSYSEIRKIVDVSKSTLTFWFKNIKLDDEQLKNIRTKGKEIFREKIKNKNESIQKESAAAIKNISRRELWLIGIVLYWRERLGGYDIKNGLRFSSDDPHLIRLFIKWLKDVGQIGNEEFLFDIFLKKDKKPSSAGQQRVLNARRYWSKITDFPEGHFIHTYFNGKKKKVEENDFGFLRVRVAKSSILARQVAGWVEGMKNSLDIS